MTSPAPVDALLRGFCDDAAIFPPGNLPLAQAIPAHREHLASGHAGLVGPFIVSAAVLDDVAELVTPQESFEVAVTVADVRQVADVLTRADAIPGLRVAALEVAVPADVEAADVVPTLNAAVEGRDLEVFVELPRDERRPAIVATLMGTPFLAKLRTGGVRADLYPDERELAEAVVTLVEAGVPFKATAGLHHALRNTDPSTQFEQHGFLNLLAAVDVAQNDGALADVEQALAERDGELVAARVRDAAARAENVRDAFRSFGTCSIVEPRDELADLGFAAPTSDTTASTLGGTPAATDEGVL